MTFVSGRYERCVECQSADLTTVRESFDVDAQIYVGEQRCVCGTGMLYSRRPTKEEQQDMAKSKKKQKPAPARRERKPVGHEGGKRVSALRKPNGRVNTIKSNGDLPASASAEILPEAVSVGEAMRLAVEALGDVKIDADLAPSQLRQLAEAYERVTRERAAFEQKSEQAKTAKKALESATDFLLERVKSFTHPAALPLFDQAQAEDDEADMLAGGDVSDGEQAEA